MNYIKIHKHIQLLAKGDIELRPIHKSMLDALFMFWNKKDWSELFNIDRDDLMEYSRISSRKTYYETLSFLQEREYIVYKPSKNPDIASTFGMGKKVTSAITSDTSCAITSTNTSDTSSAGSSGSTIYINLETIKPKTIKLINEYAPLLDECLESWIINHTSTEKPKKTIPGKVGFDFSKSSEEFKKYFLEEFISAPKQKKKSKELQNKILIDLQNYDEPFAIDLMKKAVLNNWQGYKFDKTDEQYADYLRKKQNPNNSQWSNSSANGVQRPAGKQPSNVTTSDLLAAMQRRQDD